MGRRSLVQREANIAETLAHLSLDANNAISNFWSIFGNTTLSATPTNAGPASSILAVVLLTPRNSGNFRVDIDAGWSDGTNGDAVTWSLNRSYVTVPGQSFVVGGTTPVARGSGGKTAVGDAGYMQSDASNGVTITNPAGGASGVLLGDQKVFNTLTGLLSGSDQYYGVHGIDAAAFPLGRQVAYWLNVTATHQITLASLSFSVQEMPLQ